MRYSFVDASADVSTNVSHTLNKIKYYFHIQTKQFFEDYFNVMNDTFPNSELQMKQRTPSVILNVTELIYKSFSLKESTGICKNHNISKRLSSLYSMYL